jgi:KDO2-lipid IV(A) lauroyltransferase
MYGIFTGRRDAVRGNGCSASTDAAASAAAVAPRTKRPLLAPRHWLMWSLLGAAWLIAQLPYPLLLRIGWLIGTGTYLFAPKRRRRAATQLRRCFPELGRFAQRRLLLANAQSYGVGVIERLIGWWWPLQRTEKLVNVIDGLEHLQRAQRDGRGLILLMLHTTTMEICATLVRRHVEVDFMYKTAANPVLDCVQRRGRSRPDVAPDDQPITGTAAIQSESTRAMVKRLRAGRAILYLPDRDFGPAKAHVFAPFFGMPAATITATSRYAKMSGAQVLTVECWRDVQGGYTLRFGAPLHNFPGDSLVDDCTHINAWIEAAVRRHPEQYRWVHKRFRTQPPKQIGDASLRPLKSKSAPANAADLIPRPRANAA